jgi:hypothetical protein
LVIFTSYISHNVILSPQVKHVEKEAKPALSPYMIGLFLFMVVGSALFGLIKTATRGSFSDAE